ncbi:MAG TPA: dihydrofolate reductase family protein, partial [Candidatus Limnocylindrales bacterium]|nr:dihydrofolate reductase family protein [Candidatus Limnocylindrales bacterium]
MRKLIVHNIISIDGFYAGPGDNVMVLPMDEWFNEYNAERMAAADTLLVGRRSYELFKGFWPPVADDPNVSPAHRQIARFWKTLEAVVVSDSLTPDDTEPLRDTTRIVRRAEAH